MNRNNVKARRRAIAFALRYGWMFAQLSLMESGLQTEKSLDERALALGLAVTKAYFAYAEEVLGLADARRWLELEAEAVDPILSDREAGTLAALRNRLDAGAEVPESFGLGESLGLSERWGICHHYNGDASVTYTDFYSEFYSEDRGSRHERRMSAWYGLYQHLNRSITSAWGKILLRPLARVCKEPREDEGFLFLHESDERPSKDPSLRELAGGLCLEHARIALELTLAETSVLDRLHALEKVALKYLVGRLPRPLAHRMTDVAAAAMDDCQERARNLFAAGDENSQMYSFERAENWFALEVGHLVGGLDRADAEELEVLRRQLAGVEVASVEVSSSPPINEDEIPF
jgi:hypothetical protein